MKTFENVKSIRGVVRFHGNGFINGDCNEQKFALKKFDLIGGNVNNNVSFHKKIFDTVIDENGNEITKFRQKN